MELCIGGGLVVNEIIFQLKCIKEHLNFIKQIDDSIIFDIKVLENCISQLEENNYKK